MNKNKDSVKMILAVIILFGGIVSLIVSPNIIIFILAVILFWVLFPKPLIVT